MRVVVAGAGFAGLLAADRVARAGHEVVVLEARAVAGELGLRLADTGMSDDGEVRGDAAIVAVPMAVLRALRFSPPVPPAYRSAWQRAGLAHNAKLHVPLTRPAAASAVQSVPERFWTWTAADRTGQVQPVLHAFGGTEEGLAALGVAGGPDRWASRAAALRPELAPDLSRAMLTTWNDDPWAGESYSALTVTVADGVLTHAVP